MLENPGEGGRGDDRVAVAGTPFVGCFRGAVAATVCLIDASEVESVDPCPVDGGHG